MLLAFRCFAFELEAGYLEIETEGNILYASQGVKGRLGKLFFETEKLVGNYKEHKVYSPSLLFRFRDWQGKAQGFFYDGEKDFLQAAEIEATDGLKVLSAKRAHGSPDDATFEKARFTTCKTSCGYFLEAKRIHLSGEKIKLTKPTFYLFGHKILGLHSMTRPLGERSQGKAFPVPRVRLDREDTIQFEFSSGFKLDGLSGEASVFLSPKTFPLVSISSASGEGGISFFLGWKRMKNKFFQNTNLSGGWLGYQLRKWPLFIEGGALKEEITGQNRLFLQLGGNGQLFSFGELGLEAESRFYAYKNRRPYFFFYPKLFFKRSSSAFWFAPALDKSKPPFTVHLLSSRTELGGEQRFKHGSIVHTLRLRYDMKSHDFQEIKWKWEKAYDCLKYGFGYEHKGKSLEILFSLLHL